MNILCLCQLIEVGSDTGSERHFYFCKYAVRQGHKTIAITSNVDYKNVRAKFPGTSGTVRRTTDGVDIYYVYSYPHFRGSYSKRFYFFLTYFYSSIAESLRVSSRIDVIYAVSTPLTVGFLGYVISRLRRVPFVFEVSDVWPDAAVACGVVKSKTLIRFAHWLELFCYKKANHIVGLSRGICENIVAKGVDRAKVSMITNGVDLSLFRVTGEEAAGLAVRTQLGFENRFVVMYLGAHGAYNALDTIVDVAARFNGDERFLFVLVGDGDEKPGLQDRVSGLRLSNVMFFPPIQRKDCVAMLAAADVFVLPNRKGEFFEGNLPNKLFDFLASAKPVVVSGFGESAELIVAAGCGAVCPAEDSREIARLLTEIADMPAIDRMAMGARGRNYALDNYNREMLSERFLEILTDSIKQ